MGNSTTPRESLTPEERVKFMHRIYIACMCYAIGEVLFTGTFMLLYLSKLGIPGERILLYLALPIFISIFTLVPFAQWTERLGKIFTGVVGLSLATTAMVILIVTGFLPPRFMELLIVFSMCLYGFGYGMYVDSWYPMLTTIVPEDRRGRFFGNNRVLYQAAIIIITFVITWLLAWNSSLLVFQCCFGCIVILRVIGIILYSGIPDLDRRPPTAGLWATLTAAIRTPGYLAFSAYIFLLSLFTGACPSMFGLLSKETLKMSADQVMLIGNLTTIGLVIGFFLAGRLVDRVGTKCVFMFCHFSFALILISFLFRDMVPLPQLIFIGMPALLFGVVQAGSSVAISSEMLAVIPPDNKVMATAVNMALTFFGISFSGIFSSQMLKTGMLSSTWKLYGMTLGPYDSLLLICGVMILILVVTLGLVPSVLKTSAAQLK